MAGVALTVGFLGQAASAQSAEELARADLDERMEWFNEARFGLFVHWGIYAVLGGEWEDKAVPGYAEWIQARANIPGDRYAPLAASFKPDKFDPEKWVLAAKEAGMGYVVITTKHHDGFCMWPSEHTRFDVGDASPFQGDVLKELSSACRKHGLKFGTYYSIIDWHHSSQKVNPTKAFWPGWGNLEMKPGRKAGYVDYMKAQIRELIERYDSDILWFDGDWVSWWTPEDGDDLYKFIRELKPSIIINNRVSKRKSFKYDFGTPENSTPGAALDHFWEACWTMNHTWGYSKFDTKWKSDRVLVQKLVDIASKGGNLLLNVGPKADGSIQQEAYAGLSAISEWMKVNAESIHGTRLVRAKVPAGVRLTAKGDERLYVHLMAPFKGGKVKLGLLGTGAKASFLDGGAGVPLVSGDDGLVLDVGTPATENHVTTVVIDFPNGYEVLQGTELGLKAGDVFMPAHEAKLMGDGPLKLESDTDALGYWTKLDQTAVWKREVVVSGEYELILLFSLEDGYGRGVASVATSSGAILKKPLVPTGGWKDFQMLSMGRVSLKGLQPESFTVGGDGSPKGTKALMNLKGIILRPVK